MSEHDMDGACIVHGRDEKFLILKRKKETGEWGNIKMDLMEMVLEDVDCVQWLRKGPVAGSC
jgi:hypothetical protein